jgi:hypothetical protein
VLCVWVFVVWLVFPALGVSVVLGVAFSRLFLCVCLRLFLGVGLFGLCSRRFFWGGFVFSYGSHAVWYVSCLFFLSSSLVREALSTCILGVKKNQSGQEKKQHIPL